LLATEVLSNKDRVDLLLAVGTKKPRPTVPAVRTGIVETALAMGFKALHMPRIGHPALFELKPEHWTRDEVHDVNERHKRKSDFIRHFNDYAFEAVRTFGEDLSAKHGLAALNPSKACAAAVHRVTVDRILWREGLAAENVMPLQHVSIDAFQKALRKLLSDWTDFDVVAAHFGYGYDYICTEDKGRLVSNPIFGPQHATRLFDVKVVNALELAGLCWCRFQLPIRMWQREPAT
jgi:hypothetical protein